eukprot:3763677-Rhodomonas_salina.4
MLGFRQGWNRDQLQICNGGSDDLLEDRQESKAQLMSAFASHETTVKANCYLAEHFIELGVGEPDSTDPDSMLSGGVGLKRVRSTSLGTVPRPLGKAPKSYVTSWWKRRSEEWKL